MWARGGVTDCVLTTRGDGEYTEIKSNISSHPIRTVCSLVVVRVRGGLDKVLLPLDERRETRPQGCLWVLGLPCPAVYLLAAVLWMGVCVYGILLLSADRVFCRCGCVCVFVYGILC